MRKRLVIGGLAAAAIWGAAALSARATNSEGLRTEPMSPDAYRDVAEKSSVYFYEEESSGPLTDGP